MIMTKELLRLLAALAIMAAVSFSCNKPEPEGPEEEDPQNEEPVELEKLKSSVPVTQDWVYEDKPVFTVSIENPNAVAVTADISVKINTDKNKAVTSVTKSVEIPANGTEDVQVSTDEKLDPGFYKATCRVNNRSARAQFGFGVSPTKIVSAPDKQPDFDEYWASAKKQLEAVEMNAQLIELPAFGGSARKVYFVEMQSIADGVEGDPVTIRGYLCEPRDGKKHPVIMHFEGYDDQKPSGKLWVPYGGDSGEFSEFYLSHRGQYINNRKASQRSDGIEQDFTNIYGDWFAYHFGQKDSYYYRGAYLDCVQAIRFMATLPTSDMDNVFAEGKSQGGALSYAAAALSDYPLRAIAPGVAFMGDFPDYFGIVSWPGNTAKSNKGSMTDAEMYEFLSYYDTKNLATRISCAVIANLGLQDVICPPHTNIAPYNNLLSTDKEMHYYPLMGHDIPEDWEGKFKAFFRARVK